MIEIPEGARFFARGNDRVDVYSGVGLFSDGFVVGSDEVRGWVTFQHMGLYWVLAYSGGEGTWEYVRLAEDEVPESVIEVLG